MTFNPIRDAPKHSILPPLLCVCAPAIINPPIKESFLLLFSILHFLFNRSGRNASSLQLPNIISSSSNNDSTGAAEEVELSLANLQISDDEKKTLKTLAPPSDKTIELKASNEITAETIAETIEETIEESTKETAEKTAEETTEDTAEKTADTPNDEEVAEITAEDTVTDEDLLFSLDLLKPFDIDDALILPIDREVALSLAYLQISDNEKTSKALAPPSDKTLELKASSSKENETTAETAEETAEETADTPRDEEATEGTAEDTITDEDLLLSLDLLKPFDIDDALILPIDREVALSLAYLQISDNEKTSKALAPPSDKTLELKASSSKENETTAETAEETAEETADTPRDEEATEGTAEDTITDEDLLLSLDLLKPFDIDDALILPIDQHDEDFLEVLRNSLEEDEYGHPGDVDYSDADFFLSGDLEDIEIEEIEQGHFDELDYDTIFEAGLSDSDLLASLEQDLANLTLEQMSDLPPDIDGSEEEALPWYMYCQPCILEQEVHLPGQQQLNDASFQSGLHAIKENEPLKDGELPLPEPRDPELDDLPFSLQSIDQLPDAPSTLDQSFQSYVVSRRPDAVKAALSYTQSFGTGIYQPLVEGECPNEMQCLGHKETIYGLQFSPCGNYMATASQDATIRVWDSAKHRLLQTLTGHSTESECLRVAW